MDATVLQLRTPRTERNDHSSTQNGTERDGTKRERKDKKEEGERNDISEGPRSRTERNDFKKVGTCPALGSPHKIGPNSL